MGTHTIIHSLMTLPLTHTLYSVDRSVVHHPHKRKIYCFSNRDKPNEIRSVREDLTPLRDKICLTINYICRGLHSMRIHKVYISVSVYLAHSTLDRLMVCFCCCCCCWWNENQMGFNIMQNSRHRKRAWNSQTLQRDTYIQIQEKAGKKRVNLKHEKLSWSSGNYLACACQMWTCI